MRKSYSNYFFLSMLLTFFISPALAQDFPEPMDPPRMVNDFANILEESQENLLEQKLRDYEDSTTIEIAIVTVTGLSGYEVEEYANKLFGKWGIGKKDKDNGILILIAPNDRKLRIEVGYGLEGTIPDLFAKQVIDNALLPEVRKNDFYKGIDDAVNVLKAKVAGENVSFPSESSTVAVRSEGNFWTQWGGWFIFGAVFFLFGPGSRLFRRSRSTTYSSNDISYDSWSSSDSSSDFGGFSGGDSGGGGASGDW